MERMKELAPAHGDAHPGNLLPSSTGRRWSDFEDVCTMPRFWDLASSISNPALFHGMAHPVVDYVLKHPYVQADASGFRFALRARAIMASMTNLSLAIDGHGDLDFAQSQLERIPGYLASVAKWNGECGETERA